MAVQKRKEPLGWGLVLIVIGAILLLHNINFDVWDFIARLWPLILIAWGGWKLYFGMKERQEEKK
jgi:hypothetical protein